MVTRVRIVVTGVAAAVVGTTCLTTALTSPAVAAPEECVTAFPVDSLVRGQAVEGLTVSAGTAPEAFDGTVAGVLKDGIAPGVDMILADLTSPAVDRNGVWAGMSGSPVYADAERTQLIGAVSYTLNEGKTALAGITPAADMLALRPADTAARAELTPALTTRLAATGAATRSQLASGMRQLPADIAVSGLSARRFKQMKGWLDGHGPVTNATGTGTGTVTSADVGDIVPGGNIAASLGYGLVNAAATGTVTEVCGEDVLAFGHPFTFAGDTTYALHPAEAVTVVPGSTFGGYKLANLGDPVGSITNDRLAGIQGTLGDAPTSYDVTATARNGDETVSGTTSVSEADMVADLGLATTFAASDRALDRVGAGSARASWTITGERRDGTRFSLSYSDLYTSTYDVAAEPVADLAMQAYTLLENETEAVTIDGITTTTEFTDDTARWRIGPAFWRSQGTWKRITGRAPAVLRAGVTAPIRVELFSRDTASRTVTVPVTPYRKSAGKVGRLSLEGGYSGGDDFFFFDSSEEFFEEYDSYFGGAKPSTIPQDLARLRAGQKNDTVASTFAVRGVPARKRSFSLGRVVSGYTVLPVVVRR